MNQETQPPKRAGLEITSELFVFEEPERIKTTLNRLFGAFFLGSAAIIVLALVIGWTMAFRLSVISTISFGFIIIVHRSGYPRLASLMAILTITAVALAGVITGDGIHDAAIILLPVIIALGSLVLSRLLFYSLTGLIVGAILIIGILEFQGAIENKYNGMWGPGDIAILFIISLSGAVIMRLLTLGMTDSLVRAHTSERDYRDLFNTSTDAIFIHDPVTGDILDVNQRTLEIFGFSREELEESDFRIMTTGLKPYRFEDAQDHMLKAVDEGPQVLEWLANTKHRGNIWVEVAIRFTQIGGRDRIIAVVRDIDDRKRMEEQLRQSEKLQAVGTLAGGVAHDFNNQLTGIIGWTDMIREQVEDPDIKAATNNILTSAKRASDLTAQLLAFARKGKFESRPVDLHSLIEEAVRLLQHTIDKRITIETRLEAEAPYTTGDPSQLQNALLNLGVNARDAMPDGGSLVFATRNREISSTDRVCARGNLAPGPYVEIMVSDNGEGMDKETLNSIFEPFFTTKQASKGTGLGLASVYGTISNHKGCINVESSPGAGTTVHIGLPQGKAPEPSSDIIKDIQRGGGSGRILVIDDEDILIRTVSAVLTKEGYETVTCTDSSEGLERYRQAPKEFDLVLLDMIMPGMNGPEVFHAMREINPQAAVLIMSGATANHDVQDLADAGARGFLPKPFRPAELVRAVAEVWPDRPPS